MSDKKISDIILELDQKIDFIIKNMSNQDNNIKLILKSINELKTSINSTKFSGNAVDKPLNEENISNLEMKAIHAQKMNQNSKFEKMKQSAGISDDNDYSDDLNKTQINQNQRRGQRTAQATSDNVKMTVTQIVTDSNGKALPVAQVKITNQFGEIIGTARTNIKGRWTASLEPGNYIVNINKTYLSEPHRKPINKEYSINVEYSPSKKVDLPIE